jgi:hypothetical protein
MADADMTELLTEEKAQEDEEKLYIATFLYVIPHSSPIKITQTLFLALLSSLLFSLNFTLIASNSQGMP